MHFFVLFLPVMALGTRINPDCLTQLEWYSRMSTDYPNLPRQANSPKYTTGGKKNKWELPCWPRPTGTGPPSLRANAGMTDYVGRPRKDIIPQSPVMFISPEHQRTPHSSTAAVPHLYSMMSHMLPKKAVVIRPGWVDGRTSDCRANDVSQLGRTPDPAPTTNNQRLMI